MSDTIAPPISTPRTVDTIIAYHADCIDGFTAAWVTYNALTKKGSKCKLVPMYYNEESYLKLVSTISEELTSDDVWEVYVVDFSLPVDMLEYLSNMFKETKVFILDHHKTAFENYGRRDEVNTLNTTIHEADIILNNNLSGAGLCWDYFNSPDEPPVLVQFVQDYDLWRYEFGQKTRWANKYFCKQEQTILEWDGLDFDCTHNLYSRVFKIGQILQEKHDTAVAITADKSCPISMCGEQGLAVACAREFTSDVGHILAKKSGTFGAMYTVDINRNEVVWSLRSNGEFDVSAMAKKHGGGGHMNAAGFTMSLIPDCLQLTKKLAELGDKDER